MMKGRKLSSAGKQLRIAKQIKTFEKAHPEIIKSLKLFEMSMQEYDRVVQSLSPIKVSTSNSTVASHT